MDRPRTTSEFWKTVKDCLIEFYDTPPTQAKALVAQLRKQLLERGAKINYPNDLFYHAAPIDVAAHMLERAIPEYNKQFLAHYKAIKERNRPVRMRSASTPALKLTHVPAAKIEAIQKRKTDMPRTLLHA
jgi:hypothetical protein